MLVTPVRNAATPAARLGVRGIGGLFTRRWLLVCMAAYTIVVLDEGRESFPKSCALSVVRGMPSLWGVVR